jgi:hypothetical protein
MEPETANAWLIVLQSRTAVMEPPMELNSVTQAVNPQLVIQIVHLHPAVTVT